eukprot:154305-Pyramimonas_sp.AAC.1
MQWPFGWRACGSRNRPFGWHFRWCIRRGFRLPESGRGCRPPGCGRGFRPPAGTCLGYRAAGFALRPTTN